MIFAFLAGKKSGIVGSSQSNSIWHGYGKGMASCCISFVSIGVILCLLISLTELDVVIIIIIYGVLIAIVYMIFVGVVGLVIFTMPAFFGYGIGSQTYAAKIIELDAKKSAEELAKEIRLKETTKPHLS